MMRRPQSDEEGKKMNVMENQQEGDEEAAVRGEAAASQHENPNRTSKSPSERVISSVSGSSSAAALIIIYRLDKLWINQTLQTSKEENEASRRNISDSKCSKCDAGWEPHGGNCYYFNANKNSWNESRSSCTDSGGDSVKIDSREEQMFSEARSRGLIEGAEDKFWIGSTDLEEEGKWFWVDGSPSNESLSFWRPWEPDDWKEQYAAGEDCVRMGTLETVDSNCWFDQFCGVPQRSICKKDADLSKPTEQMH